MILSFPSLVLIVNQETFSKLLDVTVQAVGRTFDSGTWIKRSNKDSLLANGRDSPLSMGQFTTLN